MLRNQSLPPRDDVFKTRRDYSNYLPHRRFRPSLGQGTVGGKDTPVPYPEASDERTPARPSLITFLQGKGSQTQILS